MKEEKALVVFKGKTIRRIWFEDGWYFVVIDLISALTDSSNPTDYIKKVRSRDEGLKEGWGQIITPLPIRTKGGRQQLHCVNTENTFRLIRSIPSKKAEPFKRWLVKSENDMIFNISQKGLWMGNHFQFSSSPTKMDNFDKHGGYKLEIKSSTFCHVRDMNYHSKTYSVLPVCLE